MSNYPNNENQPPSQPEYAQSQPNYQPPADPYGQNNLQAANTDPYGQNNQPPARVAYPQSAPTKPLRSPILGYIAIGLVILGSLLIGLPMLSINYIELNQLNISTSSDAAQLQSQLTSTMMFMGIGAIIVTIGFILSIVSIVTKRGRTWGIIALITSIVLPWVLILLCVYINVSLTS